MTFPEYADACLEIKYTRRGILSEFGKPMNCYGFIYWAYKLCFNIDLEHNDVESFDEIHSVVYNRVDRPSNGDVVDIQSNLGHDVPHVGIFWDNCIYHFSLEGLRIERVSNLANKIKGYYHVDEPENQKRNI